MRSGRDDRLWYARPTVERAIPMERNEILQSWYDSPPLSSQYLIGIQPLSQLCVRIADGERP